MSKERKLVITACVAVAMIAVLFISISIFDRFSGEPVETEEGTELTGEEGTQTGDWGDVTEEEETTEEPTSESYPDNAVVFRHYGELMDYFRCALLRFIDIPGKLDRTCYIEAYLPEMTNERHTQIVPVIYYNKSYKSKNAEISWQGGWSSGGKLEYIYDVVALMGSTLEKAYENLSNSGGYYLKISGIMNEERISAKEIALDSLWGVQNDWGRFLETAGHWYIEQTGEMFEQLQGEIYLTADRSTRDGWICLERMEPIKVSLGYSRDLLVEAPELMEGVELTEEEKSGCLYKLTFDLKVEKCSGTVSGGEVMTEEATTEAEPSTEAPMMEEASTEAEPSTEEPTTEEATTEAEPSTEEPTTEEATTETEPSTEEPTTEAEEVEDYPNFVEYQGRMTYFRSVSLRLLSIPAELGDSCFVELYLPSVPNKEATSANPIIFYDREYGYWGEEQ